MGNALPLKQPSLVQVGTGILAGLAAWWAFVFLVVARQKRRRALLEVQQKRQAVVPIVEFPWNRHIDTLNCWNRLQGTACTQPSCWNHGNTQLDVVIDPR